ncbi:MAG: hypothetical protein LBD80_04860 [Tannerella sp.]|nr:hypothetical protein [Tannerella sp.]
MREIKIKYPPVGMQFKWSHIVGFVKDGGDYSAFVFYCRLVSVTETGHELKA